MSTSKGSNSTGVLLKSVLQRTEKTVEGALDKMMVQGSPNTSLPFVHKEELAPLNTKYSSQGDAKARITSA